MEADPVPVAEGTTAPSATFTRRLAEADKRAHKRTAKVGRRIARSVPDHLTGEALEAYIHEQVSVRMADAAAPKSKRRRQLIVRGIITSFATWFFIMIMRESFVGVVEFLVFFAIIGVPYVLIVRSAVSVLLNSPSTQDVERIREAQSAWLADEISTRTHAAVNERRRHATRAGDADSSVQTAQKDPL